MSPFSLQQVTLQEVSRSEGIGSHLIHHSDKLPTQNGIGGRGKKVQSLQKPWIETLKSQFLHFTCAMSWPETQDHTHAPCPARGPDQKPLA